MCSSDLDGVPFLVLMRILLDSCRTVDEVIRTLRDTPRAWGMTYAVADAHGEAAYIESSAVAVDVTPVNGWAAHTNHCLSPLVGETEIGASTEGRENSAARLAAVSAALGKSPVRAVETLMGLAATHDGGICQHRQTEGYNGYVESLYGFIAAPASRRMWLASGSPCTNAFEEIDPVGARARPGVRA